MYGNTVREVLAGSPGLGTADPERVELLRQFTWQRLTSPGSADPIRVFVKGEPHKVAKLSEGRYRLISAVSLVDAMADRVMFRWLNLRVSRRVGYTSCMAGLSPVKGGYRWYRERFRGKRTRALDMTAWDWTVPGWLLLALKDVVKSLAVCAPQYWLDWVDSRWESLFRDAVFTFADGSSVCQPGWGIMKSGCYLTIILNTFAQILRHHLVLHRMQIPVDSLSVVFCGDDQTIEDFSRFNEYEEQTRALGFLLKDSVVSADALHFIGFVMWDNRFEPEYRDKHAYRMLHVPDSKLGELLHVYQYYYAYVPEWFEWIRRELARRSPRDVVSLSAAKAILDGS